MRLGTGIDIVEVARIQSLVDRAGGEFLRRWFSAEEIAYCESKARPGQHLAARFAAKEAAIKALGHGWKDGVLISDITVSVEPGGQPRLRLSGRAAEVAARSGITDLHVSLSHCDAYAVASVIAVFTPS